jgi:hypothetical protein
MANLQDLDEIELCKSVAADCGMVLKRDSFVGGRRSLALAMDTSKFPAYCKDNNIYQAQTTDELLAFMRGWMARPVHDFLGIKTEKENRG